MGTIVGNGHGDPCSNPGKAVFNSKSANTFENGENPYILPPAMGKW